MGRAAALLLAASAPVAWASNVVASRYLVTRGVDPLALTAARWLLAAGLLAAYTAPRGMLRLGRRLLLAGLLGVTLFNNMLYLAVSYAPAALVGLVFGLLPVATMLVSRLYGIERLDAGLLAAAMLGFAGIALIEAEGLALGRRGEALGVAIALGSLLVWSLYTAETKKLTRSMHPLEVLAGSVVASVPFNLAAAAPRLPQGLQPLAEPTNLAILVYLAAVPGFAAYLAWTSAVKTLGPTTANLFVNLLPVASLILAVLLLGERLTPTQAAGSALVLASLALAARRSITRHPRRGHA